MNKISLKLVAIVPLFSIISVTPAHARELVFTAPDVPEETYSTN